MSWKGKEFDECDLKAQWTQNISELKSDKVYLMLKTVDNTGGFDLSSSFKLPTQTSFLPIEIKYFNHESALVENRKESK